MSRSFLHRKDRLRRSPEMKMARTEAGINTAITDHLIVLFRDVSDKALNELHNRNCFFHILLIFMAVVMESDKVAIVFVNP